MAIEKFRFVSPGVQINEIDDSIIAPEQPQIGPVVIGNTVKGPAMQPVQVSSVAELERIFGPASNGKIFNGDVWRSNETTSPTLATYAARAFLQNSSPVTVIRLAGVEYDSAVDTADMPGWTVNKVYRVYARTAGCDAILAANIYASTQATITAVDSDGNQQPNGSVLDADGNFYLSINNSKVQLSFNPNSPHFIRNKLNTDPTKYNPPNVQLAKYYFLGESFEMSLSQLTVGAINRIYLVADEVNVDFTNTEGATSAETGWVVSDTYNFANYEKLFKFTGLTSGASLSKNIKISIENVRKSKNLNVTKYGTFDVVVRNLFKTSTTDVLERFASLSLDPMSDNFIAKRIGDSYRKWNKESNRYEEYGSYSNKSVYIRVQMSDMPYGETALPCGFEMKEMPILDRPEDMNSVMHPDISLLSSQVTKIAAKSTRFGLLSDKIANADLVDLLSDKAFGAEVNLFHCRKIALIGQKYYQYSANPNPYTAEDLLTSGKILGFDIPLYGGSDGKNILVEEAFVNNGILEANPNETQNAAYRAIKRAIDIVADPEAMDMSILCVPGLQVRSLTDYMLEVCKLRGDSIALIDLEGDYRYGYEQANGSEFKPSNVSSAVATLEERAIDNSYGATYFPAVFVPSSGIYMPASIAALGAIGGTEGRSALWFAPAGFNRGGLTDLTAGIAVSRAALHLNSSDRDSLYAANINPIATFPSEGVVIFGQKTLQSTPSALDRVNVRRLVNYVKKQISRAATRVLFEPNIESTWNSFKSVVEPFLLSIKNGYGLEDAKVILDSSTTTADLVDRNIMYCKVYIKPTRAIEYIAIDFVVTNSGAAFAEA